MDSVASCSASSLNSSDPIVSTAGLGSESDSLKQTTSFSEAPYRPGFIQKQIGESLRNPRPFHSQGVAPMHFAKCSILHGTYDSLFLHKTSPGIEVKCFAADPPSLVSAHHNLFQGRSCAEKPPTPWWHALCCLWHNQLSLHLSHLAIWISQTNAGKHALLFQLRNSMCLRTLYFHSEKDPLTVKRMKKVVNPEDDILAQWRMMRRRDLAQAGLKPPTTGPAASVLQQSRTTTKSQVRWDVFCF